jgi:serine/threonine protein kinase
VPRRDRHRATSTPDVWPGFEEVSEIGRGAFATVYRAVEVGTGRPVALKVLRVGGMQARLVEAFESELRALAAVSGHPHIVTLYRAMSGPDGQPVLVLELCRGSYAQLVRDHGPLPAPTVAAVGIKIAGALETAHRAGYLHRDMKPQNVLQTAYGEPALADFGVAALQAAAQTTEGVFGFTTLHAPPEVLEGNALSPATDVYGLGSTLYQLLTGRGPFTAFEGEAPASVILRILRDPVPPALGPGVPLALSDLLASALAKDPEARPSTAAELATRLQAVEAAAGWPVTPALEWDGTAGGVAPPAPLPASPAPSWPAQLQSGPPPEAHDRPEFRPGFPHQPGFPSRPEFPSQPEFASQPPPAPVAAPEPSPWAGGYAASPVPAPGAVAPGSDLYDQTVIPDLTGPSTRTPPPAPSEAASSATGGWTPPTPLLVVAAGLLAGVVVALLVAGLLGRL